MENARQLVAKHAEGKRIKKATVADDESEHPAPCTCDHRKLCSHVHIECGYRATSTSGEPITFTVEVDAVSCPWLPSASGDAHSSLCPDVRPPLPANCAPHQSHAPLLQRLSTTFCRSSCSRRWRGARWWRPSEEGSRCGEGAGQTRCAPPHGHRRIVLPCVVYSQCCLHHRWGHCREPGSQPQRAVLPAGGRWMKGRPCWCTLA